MADEYEQLMQEVSDARQASEAAWAAVRMANKRVQEAERLLVDWLVVANARRTGQEGRDAE